MSKITELLDKAAYNSPDTVPQDLQRNDKTLYRLYFRFMACLYRLHAAGADKDELSKFKADFSNDFKYCEMLLKSALKSCREQNRLNAAIIDCRKNAGNCSCCKAVSEIIGTPTAAEEPDVEVQ